jgi:hypothetical protein
VNGRILQGLAHSRRKLFVFSALRFSRSTAEDIDDLLNTTSILSRSSAAFRLSPVTRIPPRSGTLPRSVSIKSRQPAVLQVAARRSDILSEDSLLQDLVDIVWIMCTFRLCWQEPFQTWPSILLARSAISALTRRFVTRFLYLIAICLQCAFPKLE